MQIGHWFPLYCLVVMEYWQRGPTGLLSKTGLMIALDRHSVMIARQLLVKTTVWRQEIYCWKLNSTGRSQLGTHHYHCTTITPTSLAIWHDTTNCTALHWPWCLQMCWSFTPRQKWDSSLTVTMHHLALPHAALSWHHSSLTQCGYGIRTSSCNDLHTWLQSKGSLCMFLALKGCCRAGFPACWISSTCHMCWFVPAEQSFDHPHLLPVSVSLSPHVVFVNLHGFIVINTLQQ